MAPILMARPTNSGALDTEPTAAELDQLREQLGRPLRGVRAIVFRCRTGHLGVVETMPRLPDGSPFPTLFYLTCPSINAAIGRIEAGGLMREWSERLRADPELAHAYRLAHEHYLRRRGTIEQVPEIAGISAGGMPDRVKCLHVLGAHALAEGPGINPLGDEVVELLADHPCIGGTR